VSRGGLIGSDKGHTQCIALNQTCHQVANEGTVNLLAVAGQRWSACKNCRHEVHPEEVARRIRAMGLARGDKWHLDAVVVTINGHKPWLWRAVD
jgi:hypothetical protein